MKKTWHICSKNASTLRCGIKKLLAEKIHLKMMFRRGKKLTENPIFGKAVGNLIPPAVRHNLFLLTKTNKRRQFSHEAMVSALSLYMLGPRAYRHLQNLFALPPPSHLNKMIAIANLDTGINNTIFNKLQNITCEWATSEKCCVLLFDKISLAAHVNYNVRKDMIIGFVDYGSSRHQDIADHAYVFMIRGVQKNFKQLISYTFCGSSTTELDLAMQIQEVVKKLHSIGFTVVATVCGPTATNTDALHYLIADTKTKYLKQNVEIKTNVFEVDGKQVVPLYNPPHLLKEIRNNLLNKDLHYTMENKKKVAKWDHVMKLYRENPGYNGTKLLPNLTDNHVIPCKINKNNVQLASQVFSRTVGTRMGYLAENGVLNKECADTADILIFFNDLFDSVNGSTSNRVFGALTPNSHHQRVWNKAKPILRSIKFINDKGEESSVPAIEKWLMTVENFEYLKNKMYELHQLTSIQPCRFNQDPLDNFFDCVRYVSLYTKPTCARFELVFASLMINDFHSPWSSCKRDSCWQFKSFKKMFFVSNFLLFSFADMALN